MSYSTDILHEYLQVNRLISQKFRVNYGKLNLTYPQSVVLAILECDGPMPISALAEAVGSANSTISGVVDRLERMNLVERVRSDADRRVIYVSTTKYFRDQYSVVWKNADTRFAQILKDLSDEDRETVLNGLRILSRTLSEDN